MTALTKLFLINNQANKRSELLPLADVLFFFHSRQAARNWAVLSSCSDQVIDPSIHHSAPLPTNGSSHRRYGGDEGLAPGVSGRMGEISGSQLEPNPTQDCSISR